VIGDGAMSAGAMAYEAMNNAGRDELPADRHSQRQLNMSIAPPVGAMSAYLSRLYFRQDLPHAARGGKTDQQASAEGAGQPRQPCRKNIPAAS